MLALGIFVIAVAGIAALSILSWIFELIEDMILGKLPVIIGIPAIIGIIAMVIYALSQVKH